LKTTAKRGFVLLFYGGTEGWWEGLHGGRGVIDILGKLTNPDGKVDVLVPSG